MSRAYISPEKPLLQANLRVLRAFLPVSWIAKPKGQEGISIYCGVLLRRHYYLDLPLGPYAVIRAPVTEVLGTVRRYYAASPSYCFRSRLLRSGLPQIRLLHVGDFAVLEGNFHVLVDVDLLRAYVKNLLRFA